MNGLVFRLWVLLIAVLIQVGGIRSEASSQAVAAGTTVPQLQDFDAPEEDASEEASAADEAPTADVFVGRVLETGELGSSCRRGLPATGLPPGRAPTDTPFKPPRA